MIAIHPPPPPSDAAMATTLTTKLPIELYHWPSSWRQSNDEPLTPPPSALEQGHHQRLPFVHSQSQTTTTVLPPISHFDFGRPPTPPYEDGWHSRTSPVLPPIQSRVSCDTGLSSDFNDYMAPAPVQQQQQQQVLSPTPAPYTQPIDWFGTGHKHSSHLLAEKTCEMICYVWFSPALPASGQSPVPATSLQLAPSSGFVHFMQKVLETTQVSESVIVLALHYIYVLKERNRTAHGLAGSEFRVSIAGLMLANKFVDDNTYTNKTWSEVSGIELSDVNRMEREFLRGLGFTLYVDKALYESWLKLLKGLVLAKERALRDFHHQRSSRRLPRAHGSHSRPPRGYPSPARETSHRSSAAGGSRARSTSPCRPYRPDTQRIALPPLAMSVATTPACADVSVGAKRSASDAFFSPTTSTGGAPAEAPQDGLDQPRPAKRPLAISLDIPAATTRVSPASSVSSVSPLEPLQSFARLSLGADGSPVQLTSAHPDSAPQTLVSAYRVDPSRQLAVPQNLYYYSLACSPTEQPVDAVVDQEDRDSWRRGRLRYHQPPPAAAAPVPAYYTLPLPQVVQSAQSSPHGTRASAFHPAPGALALPSVNDAVWRAHPVWNASSAPNGLHTLPTPQSAQVVYPTPAGVQHAYAAQSARTSPVAYAYADWNHGRAY